MGTTTTKLFLYKPTAAPAESGWGALMNANLDTLDGAVINVVPVGDDATLFLSAGQSPGQAVAIKHGTAGSPVTTSGPTLKVSRTENMAGATVDAVGGAGTDGAEQVAAIAGMSVGTSSTEVQTVGIYGAAKNTSTSADTNDAAGIIGVGRVLGSGAEGTAMGGFFLGRRDVATGRALGLEAVAENRTATAGSWSSVGFSDTSCVWVRGFGDSRIGAGISFGNPSNIQMDVGIGFTSQGTGGPILTASIRDDSSSITAYDLNGTHTDGLDLSGATISGDAVKLAATHVIRFGASGTRISSGSGSPESVVTAPVGSLFLRTDGGASTSLYVKTSGAGSTGWTAK